MHILKKCRYLFLSFQMLWLCLPLYAQFAPKSTSITNTTYRKDTVICATSFFAKGVLPPNHTGSWRVENNPDAKFSPDATTYAVTITNLKRDTNIVTWTVVPKQSNGLDSVKEVIRVINWIPSQPTILSRSAPDKEGVCSTIDTLRAMKGANEKIKWSIVTPSPASIWNDTASNTSIRGLPAGPTTVRLQSFKGKCALPESLIIKDTVFNILPSRPDAGKDTATCNKEIKLYAKKPASGFAQWSGDLPVAFDNIHSETATVSNLKEGKNVLIWTSSNVSCPNSIPDTIVVWNVLPSKARIVPITPSAAICSDSISISANKPTQGIGRWSKPATSNIVVEGSGNLAKIKNLTEGVNLVFFIVETSNYNCPASIDTIAINNKNPSQADILTPDTTVCQNSIFVRVQKPKQGTGFWYMLQKRPGQPDQETETMPASGFLPSQTDTTIYKWKVYFGGCSTTEDIVRIFNGSPKQVYAGKDTVVCGPVARLNGSLIKPNHQGVWSLLDNNSPIRIDNDALNSSGVSKLTLGNNYFIWKVFNKQSKCPVVSDTVNIVNNRPKPFDAGVDEEFCGSQIILKPQLQEKDLTGLRANWKLIKQPDAAQGVDFDTAVFSPTVKNLSKSGNYTLSLTVSNQVCDLSDTVQFKKIQFDNVYVTAKDSTCNNSESLIGNFTPITGITAKSFWQIIDDPYPTDKAYIDKPFNVSTSIQRMKQNAGYKIIYNVYSISNISGRTCDTLRDTVKIFRDRYVLSTVVTKFISVCSDTVQLVAEKPKEGVGIWEPAYTNEDAEVVFSPGTAHLAKGFNLSLYNPADNSGETRFKWTVQNGQCEDFPDIATVYRYLAPEKVNLPVSHLETCEDKPFSLKATNPKPFTGTGAWYLNGNKISSDTLLQSKNIANIPYGQNRFIWRVTNGNSICPSQEDTVVVIYNQIVGKPALNLTDTTLCADSVDVLVLKNFYNNYYWQEIPGNKEIPDDLIALNKFRLYNLSKGKHSYKYEVYNGLCTNSDTVQFTVNDSPSRPFIYNTKNDRLCATGGSLQYQLKARSPGAGSTGRWLSGSSSAQFVPSNQDSITRITLSTGNHNIIWQTESSNGLCSLSEAMTISVKTPPSFVSAGKSFQTHKVDGNFQADALETEMTGRWKILQGTAVVEDTTNPKSSYSKLSPGKNVFVWSVYNECAVRRDTIVIEKIEFDVPKAFSPNSDGINDQFTIKGVEDFYPRELLIFNRWGVEVYKNTIYNNDWDGRNLDGKSLADDTYYYTLKLENKKVYTGYILLKR